MPPPDDQTKSSLRSPLRAISGGVTPSDVAAQQLASFWRNILERSGIYNIIRQHSVRASCSLGSRSLRRPVARFRGVLPLCLSVASCCPPHRRRMARGARHHDLPREHLSALLYRQSHTLKDAQYGNRDDVGRARLVRVLRALRCEPFELALRCLKLPHEMALVLAKLFQDIGVV